MLSELTGLTPLYPLNSSFFQQMATIPLPRMHDLAELKIRLLEEYKIEIPCIDWNNHHYLRMSIQAYNSSDDVDRLISALNTLLPLLKLNE
jgi:isopenicillin-N epimerase